MYLRYDDYMFCVLEYEQHCPMGSAWNPSKRFCLKYLAIQNLNSVQLLKADFSQLSAAVIGFSKVLQIISAQEIEKVN